MPISYDCPHCGTHMEVLDRYAGETGPCAVCAKTITIPRPMVGNVALSNQRVADPAKRGQTSGLSLGFILAILGGSVACFCAIFILSVLVVRVGLPAAQGMREARMNQASLDNLSRIAQALQQYHDDYGTFPPAYFVDANGTPTHSWRVMILPQLGRQDLYQRYNFDVPWNAPENLPLVQQMPAVYGSFGQVRTNQPTTQIGLVLGKDTAFPYEKSLSRSQILDDHATVMALVEFHGAGVDWTDPNSNYDLEGPDGTLVIIEDTIGSQQLTKRSLTGNIGMLNGDTYHLKDTTSPQLMRDMATRGGNEAVDYELGLMIKP